MGLMPGRSPGFRKERLLLVLGKTGQASGSGI
jgi:hypothetical protein